MSNLNARILALDIGAERIGVASAGVVARLASPLTTISVSETVYDDINKLIAQETASVVVVGLPRGLNGQETQQTTTIREFVTELKKHISIPIVLQDEALTSVKAEAELQAKKSPYKKGDIDALAATYILEDYLADNLKDEE